MAYNKEHNSILYNKIMLIPARRRMMIAMSIHVERVSTINKTIRHLNDNECSRIDIGELLAERKSLIETVKQYCDKYGFTVEEIRRRYL